MSGLCEGGNEPPGSLKASNLICFTRTVGTKFQNSIASGRLRVENLRVAGKNRELARARDSSRANQICHLLSVLEQ
ncbi:hypothetical protein ANN_17064 [Periplaneta americana]|uniref:Uncharacterized protein n=1 Tax=Periplaneta americana TaxID=6978 RepID=A0ABQ8SRV3_PERAM|nr:hypothetical protein ANN_17064 [Periplaneta americana]